MTTKDINEVFNITPDKIMGDKALARAVCKKQDRAAIRASKDYKQTENGLKLISWVSVILAGFATLGILLDGGDGYSFFGTMLFALNGGLGLRYIHLNKK